MQPTIDLRSDTVTRPTPGMRRAMAQAEVGDDVFGEDPTLRRLEERLAERLGKEAAVYVPSGTMSNQIAVRVHTRPGDEMICESDCHIFVYEGGGPAVLSGVTCRTVQGRRGVLDVDDVRGLVRPDDVHQPRTRLLAIENTHNRGGGVISPIENVERLTSWAHSRGLATHLDGARLWNAAVATGISLQSWCEGFDTVSVCFSKGLGAPVGSALAGPGDLIGEARRIRKLFGGGMRQAGVIAAGALYALEHHLERLAEDHAHAALLARAFQDAGFDVRPGEVQTNIVRVGVPPAFSSAQWVVDRLAEEGVLALALGPDFVRVVTHLDVAAADAERAAAIIRRLVPRSAATV